MSGRPSWGVHGGWPPWERSRCARPDGLKIGFGAVSLAPRRVAADRLDAGGDEAVALAGLDRVGGHADRLQARRAVAVDGDARDVVEPGQDGDTGRC